MKAQRKILWLLPLLLGVNVQVCIAAPTPAIQSVEPVPADHPASADLSQQVPILQAAEQPKYPPIAKAAHITGKVTVRVTVKDGLVVRTEILSVNDGKAGQRFLETPTVENLKTWRFASDVNGELSVTYSYSIAGDGGWRTGFAPW
jgi:outer membrane biosynthesis protein TonB